MSTSFQIVNYTSTSFQHHYSIILHPRKADLLIGDRPEIVQSLPHLNAHAFRHSVASALIFAGVDPVSVSRRLGHKQVSTTTNIYAHIMSKADERNAEILDELF